MYLPIQAKLRSLALVPSQYDYEKMEKVYKYFETYNDERTSSSSDSEDTQCI